MVIITKTQKKYTMSVCKLSRMIGVTKNNGLVIINTENESKTNHFMSEQKILRSCSGERPKQTLHWKHVLSPDSTKLLAHKLLHRCFYLLSCHPNNF